MVALFLDAIVRRMQKETVRNSRQRRFKGIPWAGEIPSGGWVFEGSWPVLSAKS